ncbi:uncharacterized protein CIMG_12852 [Coccidioides immitis RS]|uniref:Uncharacterized protein n=1 Tax=Coccidioides immitis (strain RS) TaxID=246410 RepID=J3KHE9_COCIM|nr:uncharacterized protein CIMG_12852 [Coccidioides immitis RS]EAS35285.3 hypothetical protein CIMG_12852 [Coccidioides immitis RS]
MHTKCSTVSNAIPTALRSIRAEPTFLAHYSPLRRRLWWANDPQGPQHSRRSVHHLERQTALNIQHVLAVHPRQARFHMHGSPRMTLATILHI